MRCRDIEKEETWKKHPEELELVCATNVRNAKNARREEGDAKARQIINNAKSALAGRLNCGPGKCPEGSNCVKPSISDVQLVGDASFDIEATLAVPQPDPSPCENNQKQYKVLVVVNFKLKAKCKCEEQAAENPIKYLGGPQKRVRTRKVKVQKRGTKKSAG